jgi:hypothetical protein
MGGRLSSVLSAHIDAVSMIANVHINALRYVICQKKSMFKVDHKFHFTHDRDPPVY